MSEIYRLLAEHCPDGVEVMTLGEIGTFVRGRRFTKADMVEDGIPCIHYGEIYTEYGVSARTTVSYVREDLRDQLRYAQPGDVIVAGVGETVEDVGKAVAWLGEGQVAIHDDSFLFRSELDPTYVSYYFQTSTFHAEKEQHVARAKVKRLSSSGLSRITIPVPPPEIQSEIVRILDKMTELHVELKAELQARTRQYEHYRDQLLACVESVRRASLSELFEMRAGKFVAASEITATADADHSIPCFGGGGLRGYVALPSHVGDRVLIGRQGALCGNVKRTSGSFYATEHAVVVHAKPEVDIRWAYHMLTAMNLNQYANKSAQPGLAVGTIARLEVPVPSYQKQQAIGAKLDQLDALVNDLSVGLPAEIEARRKQYEYYRDKLLTFEEQVA